MNFLWREKPDGARALGYGFYLAGALAVAAVVYFLHGQFNRGAAQTRPVARKSTDVAPITRSAASVTPVKVTAKPPPANTRSYRMDSTTTAKPSTEPVKEAAGGQPSFNAIDAALADEPAQTADSAFASLLPAFAAEPAKGAANAPDKSLAGFRSDYRDTSADRDFGRSEATTGASEAVVEHRLPRGSLLNAILLTTVDTSNPNAVIQFGITRSAYFNHRLQIPAGTRLLGRVSGRAMRDRLNLTADTLLYRDGSEFPINAACVEADLSGGDIHPGLAAECVPPPAWVQLAPYASEVFTGVAGLLEARGQREVSLGVGGLSLQTSTGSDLKGPIEQASSQAVQDFTRERLREYEDRYAQFYRIRAGSACWMELEADFELTASRSPSRVQASPAAQASSASNLVSHENASPN